MPAALALALPASRAACFELGRLVGRLQQLELAAAPGGGAAVAAARPAPLLARVEALLWPPAAARARGAGRAAPPRPLAAGDLPLLGALLEEAVGGDRARAARLLGWLSLGRVLLAAGAGGVLVSLFPALCALVGPLAALLSAVPPGTRSPQHPGPGVGAHRDPADRTRHRRPRPSTANTAPDRRSPPPSTAPRD